MKVIQETNSEQFLLSKLSQGAYTGSGYLNIGANMVVKAGLHNGAPVGAFPDACLASGK